MALNEQTRLLLPTLAVSLLLLAVGGLVAWYLHRSQHKASQLLSASVTRVQAVEELLLTGEKLQKSMDQFLLTGDRDFLAAESRLIKEADRWIRSAEELSSSEKGRTLIETLKNGHEQFLSELEELATHPPNSEEEQATMSALNRVFQQRVVSPARQYQRFNHNRLADLTASAQTETSRLGKSLLLIGVCGALGGLLAGFTVARRVQRRLLINQRAMAHSEQMATLGRVAAALAHELRNPLTSLRLITQSAQAEAGQVSLDPPDFAILEQEIERLDKTIQAFLDYARPPRPEKRSCVVQTLLQQTAALVQRRASQIGVTIRDELPKEPIEFQADPNQLRQVVLNILINALEASPNGGTITMRAEVSSISASQQKSNERFLGERFVEIEILDSGVGLPSDLDDEIFDAFVSTKETGTGLGLAICKRIVEDHGGELEAHDANGAGAAFTLRLPITQDGGALTATNVGPTIES